MRGTLNIQIVASASGYLNIDSEILTKSLVLEAYNVVCDTAPHSLAIGNVSVSFPFLDVVSSGTLRDRIPLFLTGTQTALCPKLEISTRKNIPKRFSYDVCLADGLTAIDTSQVTLINILFSFEK